jgi:putative FmdB family regulatory protein
MPYYGFQCEKCEEVFEIRASIGEKQAGLQPECPKCNSKKTRQMITAGLVIRGSDGGSRSLPAYGPSAGPGCC